MSTPECRKGCDVYEDWQKMEAQHTELVHENCELKDENERLMRLLRMAFGLATKDIVSFKAVWKISANEADTLIQQALNDSKKKSQKK